MRTDEEPYGLYGCLIGLTVIIAVLLFMLHKATIYPVCP